MVGNNAKKVGIVKERKYILSSNGDYIEIRGYELKYILSQRNTLPTAPISSNSHQAFSSVATETVMKDMVDRNCINTSDFDSNLIIPLLEIDTDQSRGSLIDFNTRLKNLSKELEKAGRGDNIGYEVYIDTTTKKYKFEVLIPTDHTSTSSEKVIFTLKLDNIKDLVYVDTDIGSSNYSIVAGQGSGAARTIISTGDAVSGVDLYSNIVDARDLSSTADLTARGNERVEELRPVESFNATIKNIPPFEYETKYKVGDLVTLRDDELGILVDKQILQATEYYQTGELKIELQLGDKPQDFITDTEIKADIGVE
jgi:hypothetical protein